MKCIVAALVFSISMMGGAVAQSVEILPTEGKVTAVVQTPSGSYIETERGTYSLTAGDCDLGICIKADVIRGLPTRAPEGALPDGFVATASQGDIRKAWYGQPTERYAHCVLGDCIEGGSLVAELTDGTLKEFVLPENQVFEDLTPRINDFYSDGENEIVTIRSSSSGGAAVVVYGLVEGELKEVATSSENGRTNRWLNIAGIESGIIAFVRTPHIGGRMAVLVFENEAMNPTEINDIVTGVSNHIIGSRVLDLSQSYPAKSTVSTIALAIPSQARDVLRLIVTPDDISEIAMPGKIDKAIISLGERFITATEVGQLLIIAR